jgi:hypothetical protein
MTSESRRAGSPWPGAVAGRWLCLEDHPEAAAALRADQRLRAALPSPYRALGVRARAVQYRSRLATSPSL